MILSLVAVTALCGCKPALPTPIPGVEPPEWQGVVVGQTTITQVTHLLGEPLYTVEGPLRGLESWAFEDPSTSFRIFVWISPQNGVVQHLRPNTLSVEYPITEEYPPTLEQFIAQYGEPEHVTWGSISNQSRTYIWAQRGVAVEAGVPAWRPEGSGTPVFTIEYFVPMDVSTYLSTWGQYITPREGYGVEDAYHDPSSEILWFEILIPKRERD